MARINSLRLCLLAVSAVGALASLASDGFNYVVGTQAIYSPKWQRYNFTSSDTLTENAQAIVEMGGNQLKFKYSSNACESYRMPNCKGIDSLKGLAQHPVYAYAMGRPDLKYYQIWLYSFNSARTSLGQWSSEDSEREYEEVKEWAVHVLETYSGSGKVFMAGNWEGDWMLMGASGNCRTRQKKFNMSCELRQEAIDRMIEWGRTRQRAIDDARMEAKATDVSLFYYIEFNHGPQALEGRPGVTNSVIPHVNPDLVSFSSYTSTNAFDSDESALPEVYKNFSAVMDHVDSKLSPKDLPSLQAAGFQHRLFIGEYGPNKRFDMPSATRFTTRVCHAAFKWGVPFVLYWEFYFNDATVAIIPESGEKTPLWHLFNSFFTEARSYVTMFSNTHSGSPPSAMEFSSWGAQYFEPKETGSCELRRDTTFSSEGYVASAASAEECWTYCDENPICAVGIFDASSVCHVKYSAERSQTDTGSLACVKATSVKKEEATETIYM